MNEFELCIIGWQNIVKERDGTIEQLKAELAEKERELAELTKKYQGLVKFYDEHNGTPCEQIRHQADLDQMKARKDAAYLERNHLVAALAKCFPSGTARTAIEGWHEEWHGCVYIDLPTGQVSWHYHDSHAYLFAELSPYQRSWDGHTTDEKYRRVDQLQPMDLDQVVGEAENVLLRILASLDDATPKLDVYHAFCTAWRARWEVADLQRKEGNV